MVGEVATKLGDGRFDKLIERKVGSELPLGESKSVGLTKPSKHLVDRRILGKVDLGDVGFDFSVQGVVPTDADDRCGFGTSRLTV